MNFILTYSGVTVSSGNSIQTLFFFSSGELFFSLRIDFDFCRGPLENGELSLIGGGERAGGNKSLSAYISLHLPP